MKKKFLSGWAPALAFVAVALISVSLLSAGAFENNEIAWPKNENGETYGYIIVDDKGIDHEPDLISVAGISIILPDGSRDPDTIGYIRREEHDPYAGLEPPQNPEDAMRYNAQLLEMAEQAFAEGKEFVHTIPVYSNDGKTIIGDYGIGNPEETIRKLNGLD